MQIFFDELIEWSVWHKWLSECMWWLQLLKEKKFKIVNQMLAIKYRNFILSVKISKHLRAKKIYLWIYQTCSRLCIEKKFLSFVYWAIKGVVELRCIILIYFARSIVQKNCVYFFLEAELIMNGMQQILKFIH